MKNWQAVFWDFDGVVLDSVRVKTAAFEKMFRGYGPEIVREVVAYHHAHGGISRYEKFRYYYEHLLHKEVTDAELETLGGRFSDLCLSEVLAAPFIPGALETLQALAGAGVPSFVVSGTPQEEVRHVVAQRGLTPYFREVHGSPRKKPEILSEILMRRGYQAGRCLFLGDAMTDYKAAVEVGTRFLGIVSSETGSPFPPQTPISRMATADPKAVGGKAVA